MAPELLDDDEDQMGFGIDVYAFAILVYEIASGKEPFAENGKSISLSIGHKSHERRTTKVHARDHE